MKNLTKLFVAAALLCASFACTTDATEDLGVAVGGQTEIVLSLEASRTQLGEKADGVYPLYWSEGDKIAVNGVASEPLTASADGKASATFTVNGIAARPYNIVYPAAEGVSAVTEGCYPVVFPAAQTYKAGNVDGNAIVLYGYAEEGTPTLCHLSGVLRFDVKGSATLSSLNVVATNGALAGTYDVNCSTGALTAQAGSTSDTVALSFGDGLTLGAEATPIYVAVPAGEYGEVIVTLNATSGEKMVAKFNTDGKAISAGKVREFAEFEFAANAGEATEYIIDSKEALINFAKNPTKSAKVTANIDMSGYDWTPIDGFAANFDGGNFEIKGLNAPLFALTHAIIKNVKLVDVNMTTNNRLRFGALACEVVSTGNTSISNCEVSGTITVSNPGFTPASSYSSIYDVVSVGGLVGYVKGAAFVNCENKVAITVSQVFQDGASTRINPTVGGIAGYVNSITPEGATEKLNASFVNCTNRGALNYADNATARCLCPSVGGVLGFSASDNGLILTSCKNYGDINVKGVIYGSNGVGSSESIGGVAAKVTTATSTECYNYGSITLDGDLTHPHVGGIFAYSLNSSTTNCHNLGAIEIKSTATILGVMIGGVVGSAYDNQSGAAGVMQNCTNDATIKIMASTRDKSLVFSSKAYYYRIGGLSGFPRHPVSNCENKAGGDIFTSGDIANLTTSSELATAIAGCFPYGTQGAIKEVINRGDVTVTNTFALSQATIDASQTSNQPLIIGGVIGTSNYNPWSLENHGKVTFSGSYTGGNFMMAGLCADGFTNNICPHSSTNYGEVIVTEEAVFTCNNNTYIAGIVGITERNKTDVKDMVNNGAVTFNGTITKGGLRMGGFTGYIKSYSSNVTNNAPITIGPKATTLTTEVGGLVGYFAKGTIGTTSDWTNTENGDITINAVSNGALRIGGCVGNKANDTTVFENFINSGDITVGSSVGSVYIGGNVGILTANADGEADTYNNMTNNGNITLNGETYDSYIQVGGCFGYSTASDKLKMTNLTNNGAIKLSGTYTVADGDTGLNVGGVISNVNVSNNHTNLLNSETGDITINVTTTKTRIRVGGIAAKIQDSTTGLTNKGDITISGSIAGGLYASGLIASTNGYHRTNLLNEGNVTISASGTTLYLGGLFTYGAWEYGMNNIANKGKLEVTKDAVFTKAVYMGGIIALRTNGKSGSGQPMKLTNGCYNSGDLIFNGTCSKEDVTDESAYNKIHNLYMGGLVGQSRTPDAESYAIRADGFTNSGNITFGGKVEKGGIYIGGIGGDMDQPTSTTYWTGPLVNVGNIDCSGEYSGVGYVGGIFGEMVSTIDNCVVYSSVFAPEATGVGMVTGSSRENGKVVATNCQIGGRTLVIDAEDETFKPGTIEGSNFQHHIYGSGANTDWTGTDNYDGCTFLAEKPVIE